MLPVSLGWKGGRCDMARKSRKNLPIAMSVPESSLAMDTVPESADNLMLQISVDLERIATVTMLSSM